MNQSQFTDAQHFYYQTTFQSTIQLSLQLSAQPAPQQTPYVFKYQAIKNLKALSQSETDCPFNFIIEVILGQIYSDVDQTGDSLRSYESALHEYQKYTQKYCKSGQNRNMNEYRFAQYLLVIYNMLGLSYINREQNQLGFGCFAKSMDLYQEIISFKNSLGERIDDCYHNRSDQSKGRKFQCYYMGGLNMEEVEASHTLTLFYLAQSYTKLGLKEKAAENCGKTLQRQFATNKFEIKEFCLNLIGLAEYYQGNGFFAQTQYIIMLGLQILPEGSKKKTRAKLQIALGELYGAMLEYCVNKIKQKTPPNQQDLQSVNKQFLIFESFKQPFPAVSLAKNLEETKSLFRKSNTQYKKALQIYVLDGYVTEHIDILFAVSKLYHNLCKIDLSRERVCGMLEKRREMLEPLLKELNPKAFPATWQKILVETSEIYSDLFHLRNIMAIDVKDQNKISEDKLVACAKLGEQLNQYYRQILIVLETDNESEKNAQFYRSIINSKFNIAKITSKLVSREPKVRVQYLKRSLEQYKQVRDYIKSLKGFEQEFEEQLKLTNQMIAMMPPKIDRINYGQVSPLQ